MCVPAPAVAAPADVTVRVEGSSATLVPRTAIRTNTATVNKDGTAGHDCTGTSAAGALEQATGGDWNGSWFDGLGYGVERIRGESHVFPEPDFFTLWIDNRWSPLGVCQAELEQADEVLFFVDRCVVGPAPDFACQNPPVLPLGLSAPRTVTLGKPFTTRVVAYASSGTSSPAAQSTVAGGDVPATANAAGTATVVISTPGEHSLRASQSNRARSASVPVCATTGSDGLCNSVVPKPDRTPPAITILGIVDNKRYARRQAPRRLRARIAPDPSGLLAVKLRLTRNAGGGRCTYFSGRSERLRRNRLIDGSRCGATRGHWFGVGDRQEVDYLLPKRLPRGRYVLDVNAIDKAYNRADKRKRGHNRIVFHVR
ncbi:MAG: hypothetical protein ACRDKY_08810 [Solirubrobacteraceae bacterium]